MTNISTQLLSQGSGLRYDPCLKMHVGAVDLQVAIKLLHMCGGFCRLTSLAHATPPSLVMAF